MECRLNQIIDILSRKVGLPMAIKIIYKYNAFKTPTSKLITGLTDNIKKAVSKKLSEKILVSIKPNKHFRLKYKHFNSEKLIDYANLNLKNKKNIIVISNYWYECLFKIHQKNIKNTEDIQSLSGAPYSYNSKDSCYTLYYKFYLIN